MITLQIMNILGYTMNNDFVLIFKVIKTIIISSGTYSFCSG